MNYSAQPFLTPSCRTTEDYDSKRQLNITAPPQPPLPPRHVADFVYSLNPDRFICEFRLCLHETGSFWSSSHTIRLWRLSGPCMETECTLLFSQDFPFHPIYSTVKPVQILTFCSLISPLVSAFQLCSAFPTILLNVSFVQKFYTRFSFTPCILHVMPNCYICFDNCKWAGAA